jgi:hypothetical protein
MAEQSALSEVLAVVRRGNDDGVGKPAPLIEGLE